MINKPKAYCFGIDFISVGDGDAVQYLGALGINPVRFEIIRALNPSTGRHSLS